MKTLGNFPGIDFRKILQKLENLPTSLWNFHGY